MQFKIYPSTRIDICTPFIQKEKNMYCRLIIEKKKIGLIEISYNENINRIKIQGIDKSLIIGKRIRNRDRLIEFVSEQKFENNFIHYIKNNTVIATFPITYEEALIKTIIRQLISSKMAKKLFSSFIKTYGYFKNGLFSFPTINTLEKISENELNNIGLGFHSKHIIQGIRDYLNGNRGKDIKGIGIWSDLVLKSEIKRNYNNYPIWDKSGKKIENVCGFSFQDIENNDRHLIGDLYVYGMSYLENGL